MGNKLITGEKTKSYKQKLSILYLWISTEEHASSEAKTLAS